MTNKTIYEIMLFNNIIYKIIEQQLCFPINISYKLYKLKKELDEIEAFMNNRWILMFGEDYDVEKLTPEEIIIYNATLSTQVNVDLFDIKSEEITANTKANLSVKDIEVLLDFLKQ